MIWDKDRLLLRRESQQGMYRVTAWFAARTATSVPIQVGCASIQMFLQHPPALCSVTSPVFAAQHLLFDC